MKVVVAPPLSDQALSDSCNNPADFAMENGVVTPDNLFLLGSTAPEHHVKGFSARFVSACYDELENDPDKKAAFIEQARQGLARRHGVDPNDIVIVLTTRGSVRITYMIRPEARASDHYPTDGSSRWFDDQEVIYEHLNAFQYLRLHPESLDSDYDRDYRCVCHTGHKRGSEDYHPPEGYIRYGLRLFDGAGSPKFKADPKWLGNQNGNGEWAVAYCLTTPLIDVNDPIRNGWIGVPFGGRNFGKGIVCSPKIDLISQLAAPVHIQGQDGSKVASKVLMMCRVNTDHSHRCMEAHCPDRDDYSLHRPQGCPDIWFIPAHKIAGTIRPYGLLVHTYPAEPEKPEDEDTAPKEAADASATSRLLHYIDCVRHCVPQSHWGQKMREYIRPSDMAEMTIQDHVALRDLAEALSPATIADTGFFVKTEDVSIIGKTSHVFYQLGEPLIKASGCKYSLIEGTEASALACRTCQPVAVLFHNSSWRDRHYDTPLRELKAKILSRSVLSAISFDQASLEADRDAALRSGRWQDLGEDLNPRPWPGPSRMLCAKWTLDISNGVTEICLTDNPSISRGQHWPSWSIVQFRVVQTDINPDSNSPIYLAVSTTDTGRRPIHSVRIFRGERKCVTDYQDWEPVRWFESSKIADLKWGARKTYIYLGYQRLPAGQ
jgi:hypothetical protein